MIARAGLVSGFARETKEGQMDDHLSVGDTVVSGYAAALKAVHGKRALGYAGHRANVLRLVGDAAGADLMLRAAALLRGDAANLDAYVNNLIRRHGAFAADYTRRMAKDILAVRDVAGHAEWMRMAAIIDRSNNPGHN